MSETGEKGRKPWEWRLALNHGFWDIDGKPTFHAHDYDELAACEPAFGLHASTEPPNEGSTLCPGCMTVVRATPLGRRREYGDS